MEAIPENHQRLIRYIDKKDRYTKNTRIKEKLLLKEANGIFKSNLI